MILVYDINSTPDMASGITFDNLIDFYKAEKILLYSSSNDGVTPSEKPFFIKEDGDIAEIVTVDLKDMTAVEFIETVKRKINDKK